MSTLSRAHCADGPRAETWTLTLVLLLLLLGSGRSGLAGQACKADIPSEYAEMMMVVSSLRPGLDTIPIRGKLHVAVRSTDGRIEPAVVDTGATVRGDFDCRSAFLWTSRGDSLVTFWGTSLSADSLAGVPGQDSIWGLLDKPRPVPFTAKAYVQAPQIARALLASYQRLGDPPPERATTTLLLVVDSTGRSALSRIARSSGIRRLDEAALRFATEISYIPARYRTRAVAAWFVMLVRWHPHRDSVDLRCC